MYNIEIKPSCQRDIEKLCKKNPVLREALEKKMNELIINELVSRFPPSSQKEIREQVSKSND